MTNHETDEFVFGLSNIAALGVASVGGYFYFSMLSTSTLTQEFGTCLCNGTWKKELSELRTETQNFLDQMKVQSSGDDYVVFKWSGWDSTHLFLV